MPVQIEDLQAKVDAIPDGGVTGARKKVRFPQALDAVSCCLDKAPRRWHSPFSVKLAMKLRLGLLAVLRIDRHTMVFYDLLLDATNID
jgi:hypothetical protein